MLMVAIGFCALTAALCFFDERLSRWGDNAQFIVLAQSIASGQGLREINHPAKPAHHKYPCGFPLLLAPLAAVAPNALLPMKVLVLALFVACAVGCFALFSRIGTLGWAFAVAMVFLCNRLALLMSHQVMSEIPYLAATVLCLLALERLRRANSGPRASIWLAATLAAAAVAMLLRSIGIALSAALFVGFLIERRWRRAAAVVAVAAATRCLDGALRAVDGGSLYTAQFFAVNYYDPAQGTISLSDLVLRVGSNVWRYITHVIPATIVPAPRPALIAVAVVVIVGWIVCLRRHRPLALYATAYGAALALWPSQWAVPRFVLPLLPFALWFGLQGLLLVGRLAAPRLGQRGARVGRGVLVAVAVALCVPNLLWAFDHDPFADKRWLRYYEALRWARRGLPPSAVVLCRKPYIGYLLSGRRTVGVEPIRDADRFFARLDALGVDHVVLDALPLPGTRRFLLPHLVAHPKRFVTVHETAPPTVYVLRYLGTRRARGPSSTR